MKHKVSRDKEKLLRVFKSFELRLGCVFSLRFHEIAHILLRNYLSFAQVNFKWNSVT